MSHSGELLSAFLDGELRPAEQHGLLNHLRDCVACRDELAAIDTARSAVRSLPLLEPPLPAEVPSLATQRKRRMRPSRFAWVAAAAAALVLAFGLVRGDADTGRMDFDGVVDQHVARVSLDPGVAAIKVVTAVNAP